MWVEMGDIRPSGHTLPIERAVARLAASQFALVTTQQAMSLGMSKGQIKHAVRCGRWDRLHPGVFRLASSPCPLYQRLAAVCLYGGPDTYASHLSAASLWKLNERPPAVLEISTTRELRSRPEGMVIHRIKRLPSCDRAKVSGLRVTDVGRTLLDLAAEVPEEALENMLDDALCRGLTSVRRLQWRLDEVGAQGKSGAAILRRLVRARPGSAIPESRLEGEFLRLLRRAGLPEPERQVVIRSGGRFVGRVDFAYMERGLVIECDGYRYHSNRQTWEHDLVRRNQLEALGLRVLNVTWEQVTRHGERVAETIRPFLGDPTGNKHKADPDHGVGVPSVGAGCP